MSVTEPLGGFGPTGPLTASEAAEIHGQRIPPALYLEILRDVHIEAIRQGANPGQIAHMGERTDSIWSYFGGDESFAFEAPTPGTESFGEVPGSDGLMTRQLFQPTTPGRFTKVADLILDDIGLTYQELTDLLVNQFGLNGLEMGYAWDIPALSGVAPPDAPTQHYISNPLIVPDDQRRLPSGELRDKAWFYGPNAGYWPLTGRQDFDFGKNPLADFMASALNLTVPNARGEYVAEFFGGLGLKWAGLSTRMLMKKLAGGPIEGLPADMVRKIADDIRTTDLRPVEGVPQQARLEGVVEEAGEILAEQADLTAPWVPGGTVRQTTAEISDDVVRGPWLGSGLTPEAEAARLRMIEATRMLDEMEGSGIRILGPDDAGGTGGGGRTPSGFAVPDPEPDPFPQFNNKELIDERVRIADHIDRGGAEINVENPLLEDGSLADEAERVVTFGPDEAGELGDHLSKLDAEIARRGLPMPGEESLSWLQRLENEGTIEVIVGKFRVTLSKQHGYSLRTGNSVNPIYRAPTVTDLSDYGDVAISWTELNPGAGMTEGELRASLRETLELALSMQDEGLNVWAIPDKRTLGMLYQRGGFKPVPAQVAGPGMSDYQNIHYLPGRQPEPPQPTLWDGVSGTDPPGPIGPPPVGYGPGGIPPLGDEMPIPGRGSGNRGTHYDPGPDRVLDPYDDFDVIEALEASGKTYGNWDELTHRDALGMLGDDYPFWHRGGGSGGGEDVLRSRMRAMHEGFDPDIDPTRGGSPSGGGPHGSGGPIYNDNTILPEGFDPEAAGWRHADSLSDEERALWNEGGGGVEPPDETMPFSGEYPDPEPGSPDWTEAYNEQVLEEQEMLDSLISEMEDEIEASTDWPHGGRIGQPGESASNVPLETQKLLEEALDKRLYNQLRLSRHQELMDPSAKGIQRFSDAQAARDLEKIEASWGIPHTGEIENLIAKAQNDLNNWPDFIKPGSSLGEKFVVGMGAVGLTKILSPFLLKAASGVFQANEELRDGWFNWIKDFPDHLGFIVDNISDAITSTDAENKSTGNESIDSLQGGFRENVNALSNAGGAGVTPMFGREHDVFTGLSRDLRDQGIDPEDVLPNDLRKEIKDGNAVVMGYNSQADIDNIMSKSGQHGININPDRPWIWQKPSTNNIGPGDEEEWTVDHLQQLAGSAFFYPDAGLRRGPRR